MNGESIKILLVEDNEHDVTFFNHSMEKAGLSYQLTHYFTAEEAAADLSRNAEFFDLIVSDYRLPGMNGLEFYERITDLRIEAPFILITGFGNEELKLISFQSTADCSPIDRYGYWGEGKSSYYRII
ncbi:MAG: response regulator [FCB group bacterium]|nr:response regulator [FCB group bacterium]